MARLVKVNKDPDKYIQTRWYFSQGSLPIAVLHVAHVFIWLQAQAWYVLIWIVSMNRYEAKKYTFCGGIDTTCLCSVARFAGTSTDSEHSLWAQNSSLFHCNTDCYSSYWDSKRAPLSNNRPRGFLRASYNSRLNFLLYHHEWPRRGDQYCRIQVNGDKLPWHTKGHHGEIYDLKCYFPTSSLPSQLCSEFTQPGTWHFPVRFISVSFILYFDVGRWYRIISPRIDIRIDNVGKFRIASTKTVSNYAHICSIRQV